MSADMLTATIAVPADREQPIAFAHGRHMIEEISEVDLFKFDDPESQLDELLDNFDPGTHLDADGAPTLEVVRRASLMIVDALQEALDSKETSTITAAGYLIYVSGGPSWGDAPTDAAEAIWNAYYLPETVLRTMGFVPDYSLPLSRSNGNPGRVSDTDVVDAIALGLGTKPKWSGADDLEWIADTISAVRPHPGDRDPVEYRQEFTEQHSFDPISDAFLSAFLSEEAIECNDEWDEERTAKKDDDSEILSG